MAPYFAPLCPAGHLPSEGGDRPVTNAFAAGGGSVRQDEGGCESTLLFPAAKKERVQ